MATINSVVSSGGAASIPRAKPNKPVADAAAGTFNYNVPGHGIQTVAGKDAAGDTWYLTQGGQYRNVRTNKVNPLMPSFVKPQATTTTTTNNPVVTEPPAATTPDTTKGFWDFMPTGATASQYLQPWKDAEAQYGQAASSGVDPAIQAEIDRVNAGVNTPMRTADDIRAALLPAYNLERDRGLAKQQMMLAAKGLTGSGAEDTQNRELIADNSANLGTAVASAIDTDANRRLQAQQIGAENIGNLLVKDQATRAAALQAAKDKAYDAKMSGLNAMFNAAGSDYKNYLDLGLSESQRKERQSNEAWDRNQMIIQTLLGFLPQDAISNSIGSSASLTSDLGKILADYAAQTGTFAGLG